MTKVENDINGLTDMERDVIGEVMNISMGAAATALSTILDKKVSITTPVIKMVSAKEFEFSYLEPALGVLIKYTDGINGSNVLIMKEEDLKKILRHMLSVESEEDMQFDEISLSALCELMNQMMGSSSSALASFFSKSINISTPEILHFKTNESVKEIFALPGDQIASIKFKLIIDGLMESEFISAMEPRLAKEMALMSLGVNEEGPEEEQEEKQDVLEESERPELSADSKASEVPAIPELPKKPDVSEMPEIPKQEFHRPVHAEKYQYKPLKEDSWSEQANSNNLDLMMSVPIQITVELGRTKKKIRDIMELAQGNIVELDKQAGDQVDIMANGRLIAKGDVVVVDDNYSVRITEIIKNKSDC